MRKSVLITLFLLSILLVILVAQKTNLTTADLGRHIKNGEIMLNAGEFGLSRSELLYTNFYSYTEPDTPFVNHHWASGVLFYFIFSVFGWTGLSIFNILLIVGSFALLFLLAQKKLPLLLLTPLSLLLLPLIADRTEIRPETISYLFIAVFIYLLVSASQTYTLSTESRRSDLRKYLYILPIIMLLWANLHIYFVFGLFIIGAFIVERVALKDWQNAKSLLTILLISIIASCITPFGPEALLYPFTIFQSYGYKLVENQSISYLVNVGFNNPAFLWWKISAILTLLATLWTLYWNPRRFPIALGIIALTFGTLSFFAIRNISIFGLILLPYLAHLIGIYSEKASRRAWLERSAPPAGGDNAVFPENSEQVHANSSSDTHIVISTVVSLVLLITVPIRFSSSMPWSPSWGVGLLPEVNASAEFVREHEIEGPFFNNYDIGGYFIFHQFPGEKPFVDNRPEAYSVEFFQETYVPMQEDTGVWNKELEKYNFNAIWFYRHDLTPWAQRFLIARVQDPEWAPVYVDNYVIIFLHRNLKNSQLIEEFELPKEIFSTTK